MTGGAGHAASIMIGSGPLRRDASSSLQGPEYVMIDADARDRRPTVKSITCLKSRFGFNT